MVYPTHNDKFSQFSWRMADTNVYTWKVLGIPK